MEMSLGYLQETINALEERGYKSIKTEDDLQKDGVKIYDRTSFDLSLGEDVRVVLEHLIYPNGEESYWLEIKKYYKLWSYNFEIDSWKYRDDRVEFRYYTREDGVALTFILQTD